MRRQLEAKESICYLLFVPTSITTSCIDYIFMGVPPKYQNRYRYRKIMGFTGLA